METKEGRDDSLEYNNMESGQNPSKRDDILKRINVERIRNISLAIVFNIIFPYIIYLISNMNNFNFLHSKMIRTVYLWYFIVYVYEFVIIYGIYLLFKSIFKKSLPSNICLSVVLNLISIISYYKVSVVQKPLLPEDLSLIGNILEIAGYGNLKLDRIILIQIIVNAIILSIQFIITKYTHYEKIPKTRTRIIMAVTSILLLSCACLYRWNNFIALRDRDLDPRYDYRLCGATVDFFKNIPNLVYKPKLDIYSEETVNEIKQETENIEYITGGTNPNIIVIMAESFSDITKLNEIEFESNPIPNYKNLSEDYANGNTVVSIYGGETSMSEFEFLTCSSTRFLNGEKYPYVQIVKNNKESIVRVLKEQGYYTTAIHPNSGGFYNRRAAYQRLGFDKTVFIEDMDNIDSYYKDCISDMDTAEEIINQYESCNLDKKFIFAVTIESHTPYVIEKYDQNEIKLKENNLSEEQVTEIETYAQGIYNLDKTLKNLTEYFSKKQEEVMIVLYGDHLPLFNYLYDNEYGDTISRYQTPYLIWTNYDKEIEDEENMSIAKLAMKVMENANIELPWYYRYISKFYQEYPVCTNRFLIDKEGRTYNSSNKLIDNYNIIQYDLLYN